MTYTVGQMAKMLGLAGSTLRYYDKEGLLPFVERSSGGIRMFREKDYEWLQIIECLKKAGMSIKDIKKYIVLLQQGDSTIQERLELFQHQRTVLLELVVGWNTPSIIRLPFDRLATSCDAPLVRLNRDDARVPDGREGRAAGLQGDIAELLPQILPTPGTATDG